MKERKKHIFAPEGQPSACKLRRVSVAALASLILSACVNPETGLDKNSSLTSSWVRPEDPQESIGKKEHPIVIAKYGGIYSNAEVERLVAVIVGKLVSVSDDPSRVFKVTLLNSPKVNAFALPGGYLYITRGLLALANDSSEVAAVLAHEMAHVSSNHAIVRKERLEGAAIGERVANQVLEGNTAGQFAVAANKLRLAAFSQDQELQADTIGIRMIGNAGYDPYAAERFLKTMDAYRSFLSGDNSFDDAENFGSSHPSTPRRIELARRHARFFGAPGIGSRESERYFEGINGMMFGDAPDEGFVRGRVFSHAGLGVTFKAPSGFQIDNQSKAVLVSGPNDLATRFDATVVSTRTSLKDYLRSGWITGLVEETIREEPLNGLETASATARGDGWRFKVRVIRNESQVFRFITAAPQTNTNLDAVSRQITGSFRTLSKREIAELKPLTIRVITARAGDSQTRLASRMQGTNKQLELFRLLNGLSPNDTISPGAKLKIVSNR